MVSHSHCSASIGTPVTVSEPAQGASVTEHQPVGLGWVFSQPSSASAPSAIAQVEVREEGWEPTQQGFKSVKLP